MTIVITTATSLCWPKAEKSAPPAKGDRRPLQERIEAAERASNIAQIAAQPHRQGSDDPRLCDPLGRFCAAQLLGDHCRQAGVRYREVIEDDKIARGFTVNGWAPSDRGYAGLTDEQIQARKELAIRRRAEADAILRGVMWRLPWVMERLVYEEQEPSPYDHGIIRHGLIALSDAWGLSPRRFGA